MKKQEFKGLGITYYRETLENGLEVVLIPMEDKKNYFISYATRFGSEITTFTPTDTKEKITVPNGIAHFLEHKMFEQEDGIDPFTFYSKSGTGSNASTSYDNTQYICYGTKNFEENLRYLIQFVNKPYFTDENVEKEKGIIAQELHMYEDMPDFQLEMRLRQNIYHEIPRRIDIGGSVEEINRINKEDLYTCYNNFYSPNNMFIIIGGNFNQKEASRIIYEELELKENKPYPIVAKIHERKEVRLKNDKFTAEIEIPKIALGLKIKKEDLGITDQFTIDAYLLMLTRILFGSCSLFKERVIEKKIMTSMYTDWEKTEDFKVFYIMAETEKPEELIQEIKQEFKNLPLDEETFNRTKKVWIANAVRSSDNVEAMVYNAFDDMLYNKEIIDNEDTRIRNLEFKVLQDICKKIDFDNIASVIMLPKKIANYYEEI